MPPSRLAFLVLLVGCNVDNAIADKPGEPVFDDGDPVTLPGDSGPATDTAGDTAPDTAETAALECPPLDLGTAGTVAIAEACAAPTAPAVTDPWDVTIEYQYDTDASGVIVMPAVGELTDDDGDGDVDADDTPDIAFTIYGAETLVALSGDYSGPLFQHTPFSGSSGVTIADVDGDGTPEVVGNAFRQAVAVRGDGSVLWQSRAIDVSLYCQPTVCDLHGDGTPEVILDGVVVDGTDGTVVATLDGDPYSYQRTPVCADLDQDGEQEILFGNTVYHADGSVVWTDPAGNDATFAAVVDTDGDAGGEVLFVSAGTATLHDDDGTVLLDFSLPGGLQAGPPCAADFDGDGAVEIAVPNADEISVFETDGTLLWSAAMRDPQRSAGCSGFDVDADGAYEVLLADANAFRIYDGATGTVRYEDTGHASDTIFEYPVVADVDGDGAAEIVVAENMGVRTGITVYGHAGAGWPAAGPSWGTHDFAVTNLEADGHVPAAPEAPWLAYNVFRARPAVDGVATADLTASILDVCVADCEAGPVAISVQVSNQGGRDVPAGKSLAIYADDGGTLRLVASTTLPAVPAGTRLEGVEFELTAADIGTDGFVAVVDDDGTGTGAVRECEEGNNSDRWEDVGCP